MNHFSLNYHHHHNLWHSTPTMDPTTHRFFFSHQNDDDSDPTTPETSPSHPHSPTHREPMFEKPLTPSDVGKLNRLVIPKQHAEKHFPLGGSATSATVDGGGGVLLGFEDETGKCWSFRYSYWNSSQSYVLTKGWSRFVKEKKLDAGDVVLFDRHRFEKDRFFIGWRRRGPGHNTSGDESREQLLGGLGQMERSCYGSVQVHRGYHAPQPQGIGAITPSFPYHSADYFHAGTEVKQPNQGPARSGGGSSKKLRLFGVNLECQQDDDDDTELQTSSGSVHGLGSGSGSGSIEGPTGFTYFDYVGYPTSHHHNHMEINFPQDANQVKNQMG